MVAAGGGSSPIVTKPATASAGRMPTVAMAEPTSAPLMSFATTFTLASASV